ncbi:M23 family metallopeptidase [Candidatus Dependentiae bacterium]|nr:M23 family metallopeptidase [Candidatus Dependentiae bacterium]
MFHKFKVPLIISFLGLITLFLGYKAISYSTYSVVPEISTKGLTSGDYYSGVVQSKIVSNNGYKIDHIDVYLDGKMLDLDGTKKINKKSLNFPLTIDTTTLLDGKHNLTVDIVDASKHQNKNQMNLDFYVDNTDLNATFIDQSYKVLQGRTIHAKIKANKKLADAKIQFLEKNYEFYPESEYSTVYESFIPVDCDLNAGEYQLNAKVKDFVGHDMNLSGRVDIQEYNFPKQKGFVVEKCKLEEEKEVSMSNRILEDAIEKWLTDSPNKKLWTGRFEVPVDIKKITTPFGEIRTTSEKGHYMHKAVDILNNPRSVIWASQEGKVVIKDRFLLTGNTIVLDHGIGVFTIYCHLEDFADIEVGDLVKKGNKIGRMGMTGYANGYHLHWELRVNNVAVDPFQWTQKNF